MVKMAWSRPYPFPLVVLRTTNLSKLIHGSLAWHIHQNSVETLDIHVEVI